MDEYNIDLLSASGHKINGPKGIGIMYLRDSVKIGSFIHGGAQERGKRAGTHNTPGIIGFAKATELAEDNLKKRAIYETKLRDYLIDRVINEIPYTKLNGHRTQRLSNNANFSFRFIEGESLLILLDQSGICASSGSACTSGSLDPSHVLLAIGLPHEIAHGSLRLTLSDETTKEEIDFVVDVIEHFKNPRNMGEIENASGVGTVGNAKCGDIMRIYLDIDDRGIIKNVKFKTFGCSAAIATSSMATELVKGKNIQEALDVTNKAVMEALDGLPPIKIHCSLLAEQAIHAALWDYTKRNNIEIKDLKPPVDDIEETEEFYAITE